MNILEQIIAYKRQEVAERKQLVNTGALERLPGLQRKVLSLRDHLLDPLRTGIIAEFKRRSPSKGIINDRAGVAEVTAAYAAHGASGLSVLTDGPSFGGCDGDLVAARGNTVPILRKDFIIDEYQVLEARAIGADVILLIAACLSPTEVEQLAGFARGLGLEVLLEIHNEAELGHINDSIDLIGINNRDLKSFTVDLDHSVRLAGQVPAGKLKIAESGIHDAAAVHLLKQHGFTGFLIGERFMKTPDPAVAFASFVNELKTNHEG